MAGLAPDTLRLDQPTDQPAGEGIIVEIVEDGDQPVIDTKGAVIEIEHGDGSVSISLDGKPIEEAANDNPNDEAWFSNLADGKIEELELGRISDELLRGIAEDATSRQQWIEALSQGIQLLGIRVEIPGLQGASDSAPVEGMSKVRHPLLLEAVLRFQANARSEMLPTDGPVKIRDDGGGHPPEQMGHNGGPPLDATYTGSTFDNDQLADALETDLNHYLTSVATEYYPDTDRMFFKLGFSGMSFKKVYFCPLRGRPISETVDAADLIVNNAATDLKNAKRVTHRVMMRPSVVKRMQILGVYRDIELNDPQPAQTDSYQRAQKDQQGVSPESMNPEDRDREIYECYCELKIAGYEHRLKGKETGLEIPYRVTIDVSSRKILAIVRNYNKTDGLPEPRSSFVKYTFVPGLGFYDIGLLDILGNTTNAITAAWREMLDNGMFANFPGFLIAKSASRQNTSIMRVPPGGGAQVDTQGMKIGEAVMPLPYNTAQMGPLMQLIQAMEVDGQRVGGTSELQVGEGRQDAPVGTTLALIDQATKILNSVHKRMHSAQAEEFKLLVECFREHPESLVGRDCPSGQKWTEQVFLKALDDCDLVPQADPNTASHTQRITKLQALNMWAMANPSLADPIAIAKATIQGLGFSNPEAYMAPPSAMAQEPPEMAEIKAGIATAKQIADAKTQEAGAKVAQANAKVEEIKAKAAQGAFAPKGLAGAQQGPNMLDAADLKIKAEDAATRRQSLGLKAHELVLDSHNQELDRQAEHQGDLIDLAREIMKNPERAMEGAKDTKTAEREIGAT